MDREMFRDFIHIAKCYTSEHATNCENGRSQAKIASDVGDHSERRFIRVGRGSPDSASATWRLQMKGKNPTWKGSPFPKSKEQKRDRIKDGETNV